MAFLFFINFSKNEVELKLENPKYTYREMNYVLQPIESQSKKKTVTSLFCLKEIFYYLYFISIYTVLNKLSEYTFTYQKYYFIHFCCLFLKLTKTFSVSLIPVIILMIGMC